MEGLILWLYQCLFYRMEDEGVLNPDSVRDLFCLQFVFLPKIQRQLDLSGPVGAITVCEQSITKPPISYGYE